MIRQVYFFFSFTFCIGISVEATNEPKKHLKFEENTGKRSEKNKLTQTTTFSLLIAGFKVFIFEITTNQRIDYFVCSVFSFHIYLANLFSKLFIRFVYI
jgi:hypothetical protein